MHTFFACDHCGATNKVDLAHAAISTPLCGSCKKPLKIDVKKLSSTAYAYTGWRQQQSTKPKKRRGIEKPCPDENPRSRRNG